MVLVLVVSAYLAGRAPLVHRLEQAERERDEAKKLAEQMQHQAAQALRLSQQRLQTRILRIPARKDPSSSIDEGMIIDALEHQQRFR
jgi:hypothetical protein